MPRARHVALSVLAFATFAACADTPTSPGGAVTPLGANLSVTGGPRNETWMWGAKNRDIVSVRALDYNNGVTKIEVAVGQNLYGPYPAGKWLDKIEVIDSPKPSKLHIVGEKLLRNAQYYVINSRVVKAGDLICVNVHFRGATGVARTAANPTATEHIVVCLMTQYAADVAVTQINYPRTISFFDMPPITATVSELMGVTATTFDCVLRINNQVRETIPMTLAAGTQAVCEFDYHFSNAGNYTLNVSAENVLPGDIDYSNNSPSEETSLLVLFPGDPTPDPDSPPNGDQLGDRLLPFCCNYFANERYDTTFTRIRVTDIGTGAVLSDSGFVEYHVAHDSRLDAMWDAGISWPVTRLAVAHQTSAPGGATIFDNQVLNNVAAMGAGSCYSHPAVGVVFGFTLCANPFPYTGPRFGTLVTSLTYLHDFAPYDPVRRDYTPGVSNIWKCADGSSECDVGLVSNIRSLITPEPLPPNYTGSVPQYGSSMAFIISIESPGHPKLISGAGFQLRYTFGQDDAEFLSPRNPRVCAGVLNSAGTAYSALKCTWSYTLWGAKNGAGNIGD